MSRDEREWKKVKHVWSVVSERSDPVGCGIREPFQLLRMLYVQTNFFSWILGCFTASRHCAAVSARTQVLNNVVLALSLVGEQRSGHETGGKLVPCIQ